jgi:hypothetical protein
MWNRFLLRQLQMVDVGGRPADVYHFTVIHPHAIMGLFVCSMGLCCFSDRANHEVVFVCKQHRLVLLATLVGVMRFV